MTIVSTCVLLPSGHTERGDQREPTHFPFTWVEPTEESRSKSTGPVPLSLQSGGTGKAPRPEALIFTQSSGEVKRCGWWEPCTFCPKGNMYLIMEFAINCLSLRIDQLKSMRSISIHVPVSIWNPSITEQEGNLRNRKRKPKIFQFQSKYPRFF